MDGPQFQHDCPWCVHLGPYSDASGSYDLYWCGGPDGRSAPDLIAGGTVLARFSDDGPDYQSSLCDYARTPAMKEAVRRFKDGK